MISDEMLSSEMPQNVTQGSLAPGKSLAVHIFLVSGHSIFEVNIMAKNKKSQGNKPDKQEKPVSKVYPVIDNDLARDNIENDLTAADRQDL